MKFLLVAICQNHRLDGSLLSLFCAAFVCGINLAIQVHFFFLSTETALFKMNKRLYEKHQAQHWRRRQETPTRCTSSLFVDQSILCPLVTGGYLNTKELGCFFTLDPRNTLSRTRWSLLQLSQRTVAHTHMEWNTGNALCSNKATSMALLWMQRYYRTTWVECDRIFKSFRTLACAQQMPQRRRFCRKTKLLSKRAFCCVVARSPTTVNQCQSSYHGRIS